MFSGNIPTNLGNLSSLVILAIGTNPLSGIVSKRNFAKLSKLKDLDIYSFSSLIFDFDFALGSAFSTWRISSQFWRPNLPTWLYTQRSLESLTIFETSFKTQDKLWNLVSRVLELHLDGNAIDGKLSNVLLNSI